MIWIFFGIFVILGIFFWLINNCFGLLKIMGIVGKFRNCDIISKFFICEFLGICWSVFKNFNVENLFYWIIGNVGIVEIVETIGKFWNCGIHLHHGCVKK